MSAKKNQPYGIPLAPTHSRVLGRFLEEVEGAWEGLPAWSNEVSLTPGEYLDLFVQQFFEAYALGIPGMFPDFLSWSRSLFEHHGMPPSLLDNFCGAFERVLMYTGEDGSGHPLAFFREECENRAGAEGHARSYLEGDHPLAELRKDFFRRLLDGDRRGATECVLGQVDQGTPVWDIYMGVFQPSLYEVGRLWQLNRLSVAQEHFCSAAIQFVMSQLYPHIFSANRVGRTLVATAVGGELHEIGIRMVSDFFEMEGWDTYYLGSDCPTSAIIEELQSRKADVLALSVTMTPSLAAAREIIHGLEGEADLDECRVIVGGKPFLRFPGLWEEIGADAWAPDAGAAVRRLEGLLEEGAGKLPPGAIDESKH